MKKIFIIIGLLGILSSCEDFLDRTPIDFPTEDKLYTDLDGLKGAVIGAYDALQSDNQYGGKFLTLMENRGDNIRDDNSGANGGVYYEIETFTETPSNMNLDAAWLAIYQTIYRCNLILQSVDNVQMSDVDKVNIVGQASFIRGLCYFNLTRLWGKVPLITKPQTVAEARTNIRAEVPAIYEQIVRDLESAKKLPVLWPDAERGRVTSYAAQALLAKVYLYQKKYTEAISELTPVMTAIDNRTVISLVPIDKTFPNDLKTSKDVLFAVQYLKGGVGESVLQNNRYRNNDNNSVIILSQSEFEAGDIRKAMVAPTGSGQRPKKFDAPATNNETSSDFPIIRCAEVMLMYAEALNETTATPTQLALDALNKVRNNAGLGNKVLADFPDKNSFRQTVYKERRLELVLECDRWFDIVRTNQLSATFPLIDSYRALYPVPQVEIENVNDKSGWQNDGYS